MAAGVEWTGHCRAHAPAGMQVCVVLQLLGSPPAVCIII